MVAVPIGHREVFWRMAHQQIGPGEIWPFIPANGQICGRLARREQIDNLGTRSAPPVKPNGISENRNRYSPFEIRSQFPGLKVTSPGFCRPAKYLRRAKTAHFCGSHVLRSQALIHVSPVPTVTLISYLSALQQLPPKRKKSLSSSRPLRRAGDDLTDSLVSVITLFSVC